MIGPIMWTCHVCHELRPDDKIGVFVKHGFFGAIRYTQNIRHCNDRPACVNAAKDVEFIAMDLERK